MAQETQKEKIARRTEVVNRCVEQLEKLHQDIESDKPWHSLTTTVTVNDIVKSLYGLLSLIELVPSDDEQSLEFKVK